MRAGPWPPPAGPTTGRAGHITHVRRPTRQSYKAGALAHGLTATDGELIAIFCADFLR